MRRLDLAACVVCGGLCSLGLLGARPAPPPVEFVDVTEAVAIDFAHENSPTSSKYLIETMGGGVALFDYNNDGRLDVFFTNGAKLEDQCAGPAAGQIRRAGSGTA